MYISVIKGLFHLKFIIILTLRVFNENIKNKDCEKQKTKQINSQSQLRYFNVSLIVIDRRPKEKSVRYRRFEHN